MADKYQLNNVMKIGNSKIIKFVFAFAFQLSFDLTSPLAYLSRQAVCKAFLLRLPDYSTLTVKSFPSEDLAVTSF